MTMLVVKKTPVLLCVTLEMESEYESNENSAKVR
jgi:hypothetical protein